MLHQGQLMPVASPKADGLRLFLDNTLVLEATLLPHLHARTILKLACTCVEMQAWLFQAPPAVWQVHRSPV